MSTLEFQEVDHAPLSTLTTYADRDSNASARLNSRNYTVKTISLLDLLAKFDAPREMDYLSIDTEGSEFEILKAFDFDRYSFKVITCEHNFTPMRESIYELLSSKGYERMLEPQSNVDDWYVKHS